MYLVTDWFDKIENIKLLITQIFNSIKINI